MVNQVDIGPARPEISVIIVSYNTAALLHRCLAKLFELSAREDLALDVVLVDNCSADASVAETRAAFPQVRIVANSENVGFARAVNQGLPLTNAALILLLNSDAELQPGCLATLAEHLRTHDDVAAAVPSVVRSGHRLSVLSAGRMPTVRSMFCHFSGLSRLSRNRSFLEGCNLLAGVHDDRTRSVEWLSGACLMLRRSALEAVGPLTERWFMYGEDMDLCARLRAQGWLLHHVPSALVEHKVGASSAVNSPTSVMWVKNLYDVYVGLYRPGPLRRFLWRKVLLFGLATRYCWLLVVARLGRRGHRQHRRSEAAKFLSYVSTARTLQDVQ